MPSTVSFALNFSGQDVFQQQEAVERLLGRSGADEHDERARLLAILAAAQVFTDADAASEAARASARAAHRADDDVARAWALLAACAVDLSCTATETRRAATREILTIASDSGEPQLVPSAYLLHLAALAELGDIAELDRALSPVGPLISAFPWLDDGRHVAWFRGLRATLDGRSDIAEAMAQRAYAVARESSDPDAQSVWIGQLAIIRWMQGRVAELEPAFLFARQAAPHEPIWAVALAWIWLRQGRRSAARGLIATLPPVTELPIDRNWLSTACVLAAVVAELGEAEIAQPLHSALEPFEDRLATIGLGVTCWGTVARPLALLAASLDRLDDAIEHYRTAIEVAARAGAHPWLAEAQWELAALLAHRAHPGDVADAQSLAAEAAATGRALHLPGIESAASRVLASVQPTVMRRFPAPSVRTPRSNLPEIAVLGTFAVKSAGGETTRWQSRKARQLLKILVARRGAAVRRETVMDLLWPNESARRLANRFSVALTVIRRALDPTGSLPSDTYLDARDGFVRLKVDALDIDVERFLAHATAALDPSQPVEDQRAQLAAALAMYHGDPLTDEHEELWAADLRREAHLAFFAAAHAFAELSASEGDDLIRIETYRRILSLDEYDQRAHEGLIDALAALGSHAQAAAARSDYVQRMSELGIPVSEPAMTFTSN